MLEMTSNGFYLQFLLLLGIISLISASTSIEERGIMPNRNVHQLDAYINEELSKATPENVPGIVRSTPGRLSTNAAQLFSGSATVNLQPRKSVTIKQRTARGKQYADIEPQSAGQSIELSLVLNRILTPAEQTSISNLPNTFMSQNSYKLEKISVLKSRNSYSFTINAASSVTIPFFGVTLTETSTVITFQRDGDNPPTNLQFQISGALDAALVESEMTIKGNSSLFAYDCIIKNANPMVFVDKFFAGDSEFADEIMSYITEQKLREMFEVDIPELHVVGVRQPGKGFQFIAFGEYQFSSPPMHLKAYVMVSKEGEDPIGLGLMLKLQGELSLSGIIQALTNVTNFPQIKMFEGLKSRAVATIASREIVFNPHPFIANATSDLAIGNHTKSIQKGIWIHTGFKLKQKLSECSQMPSAFRNLTDETVITVKIDQEGFAIIPPDTPINVEGVVTCLFESAREFFESDFAKDATNLKFNKLFYNRTTRAMSFDFEIIRNVTFISENFLTISKLHVKVSKANATSPINFDISFSSTIDDSVYEGSIVKNDTNYAVDITVSMLPLGKLIGFAALPPTHMIKSTMKDTLDFGIKDFLFQAKWGEVTIYRIAGSPHLFGFDDISMEGIMWKPLGSDKFEFAFAMSFNSVNLNDIVRLVAGENSTTGAWLADIDLKLAVCTSKRGIEEAINNAPRRIRNRGRRSRGRGRAAGGAPSSAAAQFEDEGDESEFSEIVGGSYDDLMEDVNVKEQSELSRRDLTEEERLKRREERRKRKQKRRNKGKKRGKKNRKQRNGRSKGGIKAMSPGGQRERNRNKRRNRHRQPPKAPSVQPKDKKAKDIEFAHETMKNIKFVRGLTIAGEFSLPKDQSGCRGDGLCEYLVEKMNSNETQTKLTIEGIFEKTPTGLNITLSASIDTELKLTERLVFTHASIHVYIAGKDSKLALEAKMEYRQQSGDTVVFTGRITANAKQIKISMTIDKIWEKPFGIEWMAFGNLHLAASVTFRGAGFTLGFGGTLQLGKIGTDDIISIQIYFGFNVVNPIQSYFYGNVSELTFDKISKSFDLDVGDSKALRESGFPEGLVFSYNAALDAVTIPQFNIEILPGIYFKGRVNIMGYSILGEIRFHLQKLSIKLEFDPITIGDGAVIIQRSEEDEINGPIFYGEISKEKVELKIVGFIYVVGIGAEVAISITNTEFYMKIRGRLFDVITTDVTIKASYGNLASASFQFRGCLVVDLSAYIQKITNFISSVGQKAQDLIDRATEFQKNIKLFANAIDTVKEGWTAKANARKRKIDAEIKQIEADIEAASTNCNDQCPLLCGGLPGWNSKCWKFFGLWVGCPTWNSCAYKSRSAFCLMGCWLKNGGNRLMGYVQQGILQIKKGFISFQDFLLEAAAGIVKLGASIVSKATEVYKAVLQTFKSFTEMAAQFVADSIKINHVCLMGGVQAGKSACVGLDVDLVLLTYPVKFSRTFCVGPNFLDSASKAAVSTQYPEVNQFDDKIEAGNEEIDAMGDEEEDIESKKAKMDQDINKDEPDAETRDTIARIHGTKYEPLDQAHFHKNLINGSDIEMFMQSAPRVNVKDAVMNEGPMYEHDESHESSHTACGQIRSVINRYSAISNGAGFYSDAMDRQQMLFNRARQYWQNDLDTMKRSLDDKVQQLNMTQSQQDTMYNFYSQAEQKLKDWEVETSKKVSSFKNDGIKGYKRQLDDIIQQTSKQDSVGYMRSLIAKGQDALKRSEIPTENVEKHSEMLSAVHQELETLLTDTRSSIPKTQEHLKIIDGNLEQLKAFHSKC